MVGSFSAELLKLRKRWAIRILAIIFVLIVVLLTYVLSYVIYKNPPPNFDSGLRGTTLADLIKTLYPDNFHRIALSSVNGLGSAIAIILGVLAVGSEYGWGTLKTVFTQKPSRTTVCLARFSALLVVTLVFAIILMVAAAASSVVIALIDGKLGSWPDARVILESAGALWLILIVWTMFGVMLAVIFQQSALAIGIGLVYGFIVEGLVFGLFGSNPSLQNIEKAFPGANATALVDAFGQLTRSRFQSASPLVGVTQAVTVLAAYTLVFLVVSTFLTDRRDLT